MSDKIAKNGSVFISYSRKDKEFVRKLHENLKANEVQAWVDWEGIPLSADWMQEITRAVESADAFLVVLSPDWLASTVCAQELELGLTRNKKLVPILYRMPEKDMTMHEKLAATNWVYLRDTDDHEATLPKLIEAINTDLDWVRQHTRLLQRANEWENKNHNASFLLQGADLEDAEKWANEAAQKASRDILPVQANYISASRKEALRRHRMLLTGVSFALVVSIVLAIVAVFQWKEANDNKKAAERSAMTAVANEHIAATQKAIAQTNEQLAKTNEKLAQDNETAAKAQRNAAEALVYQGKAAGLNTSTLLAIDSWQTDKTDESENILRHNIDQLPIPIAQMQQADAINSFDLNKDGLRFVSSSADGTACVWKIKDGHQEFCVKHEGEKQAINSAIFTRDGKTLITGGDDGTVRFWNSMDGKFEKKLDFGTPISALNTSPDGKWLAIGRSDSFMTAVHLSDPKQPPLDVAVPGAVSTIVISPDGQWGGIGTYSGQVEIWYVGSKYTVPGPVHDGGVFAIAFSPDSKLIISGGADSKARLAKTQSGKELFDFGQGDWVEDLAFGPDGTWFVTASDDNRLWVWNTITHDVQIRPHHDHYAQVVKISPDGQWLASASADKTLRIWDAKSGNEMMQVALDAPGTKILFSADGKSIVVGDRAGNIGIWNISTLSARAWYIEFPEIVHKVKLTTSGDLFANTDDRGLWFIKANNLRNSRSGTDGARVLKTDALTSRMAISPDSRWIGLVEPPNQAVLYNTQDQTNIVINHDEPVIDVAFSPDSLQIATSTQDGLVRMQSVENSSNTKDFKNPTSALSIAFSPDGTQLAVGLKDQISIWDIAKQTVMAQLPQPGSINILSFSKDGKWLAAGSSDASTYLWDAKNLKSAQPVRIFRQGDAIITLAFSPDLQWLATGGGDNLVHLWDLQSGSEIARIPHSDKVNSLAFSPDGKQLITVSRKMIQLWDLASIQHVSLQDLVQIACARLTKNLDKAQWTLLFTSQESYRLICPGLPAGTD